MHRKDVIKSIVKLEEYERALQESRDKEFLTMTELLNVQRWKHTVGQDRFFNVKRIKQNPEESVNSISRTAFTMARKIDARNCLTEAGREEIKEAIEELAKLHGVGPATASAVLTLIRPDVFAYYYDEVIDCFEPKRVYRVSQYLTINAHCLEIAHNLGGTWTPRRVAESIYTAARYLATHGKDLTQKGEGNDDAGKPSAAKKAKTSPQKDGGRGHT
jgi:hypothetical protein